MEDISLHILDIVENSITAKAKRIEIIIEEDKGKDLLSIIIVDDGEGMDEETVKKAVDPFYTTRTTRKVGLGLPLLAQAAQESGGKLEINSVLGKGTKIKASFGYSHIDRKPLGDIYETLKVLILNNPNIDFLFIYKKDNQEFRLDTKDLKRGEIK